MMNGELFVVVFYLYICEATAVPIKGTFTKNPKWVEEAALRLGQHEPFLKLLLKDEGLLDKVKTLIFGVLYELAKEKGEKESLTRKYNAEISTLNTSLMLVYPFARLLSCNERLRYGMAIFPLLYSNVEDINQESAELHLTVNKTWTNRTTNLTHIVSRISSIIKNESTLSEFEKIWEALKNLDLTKHTYTNGTDLSLQLLKLNDCVDADSAFKSCKSADTFWRTLSVESLSDQQTNSLADITKLSQKKLVDLLPPYFGDRFHKLQVKLATDYMEIGGEPTRLKQPSLELERYDVCTWILHIDYEPQIANVSMQMEAEWPHLTRAQRIDQYCKEFVQLYALLSKAVRTLHNVPLDPSRFLWEKKCWPGIEDYEKFVSLISNNGNDRMAFVARTAVSLCTEVKMPPKKSAHD
ncbi:uncharacterized protein LOC135839473 isoform X2 [Planococcus citri]|uniref:uncharacterized protein LOC135839473 isoform X2 n=1 Tax=Planococcus citri TaxID=170843 RepID=UPI0031F74101